MADTFRADNLEPYGGRPEWTPLLNEFARESVIFEAAQSPSAGTLPSHAALLSGLQPSRNGATERESRLPDEVLTIAEHLAAAGYPGWP